MAAFEHVDRLMNNALAQGVFPGAVVLAAGQGRIVYHQAYGLADVFSRRAIAMNTFFDLASLTKPLATVMAVINLVHHGQMTLDEPAERHIEALSGTDKARITVRELLEHRSGLPAWRPYFETLRKIDPPMRQDALRRMLALEALESEPGVSSCYSDLGFMLLQWIVESVANRSLDRYVVEEVYDPLGISSLFFPAGSSGREKKEYAATELCPWRNRLLVGEVHDDNAWITGGCAGHAGLFGTARGVYDLLQGLLAADRGDVRHPLWDRELIQHFFTPQAGRAWALGFDTPSPEGSSSGSYFSANSVGHLGFTGTSFWMDRDRSVIIILLTNRVHPSRQNQSIRSFRPVFHDAVMAGLRDPC